MKNDITNLSDAFKERFSIDEKVYVCYKCKAEISSNKAAVLNHQQYCHREENTDRIIKNGRNILYICPCGYTSDRRVHVKRHRRKYACCYKDLN